MQTATKLALGVAAVTLLLVATSASADRMEDGERIYRADCASCHDHRVNGAPKTGVPGDWEGRSWQWQAVLMEHASEGYLGMPAKGGNTRLSDYDAEVAAEYMLTVTHGNLPHD